LAAALEQFGALKTKKTLYLFAQLACPTNYVFGTGTQISGSTIPNFLAPAPQLWFQVDGIILILTERTAKRECGDCL